MNMVRSRDGTTIAYERSGSGPVLILVQGIFEQRAMESETSKLAAWPPLAEHFTVVHYDRRGRGESTDTQPYAVAREVEDIEALIDAEGGPACLSGISSGAALALEAALALGDRVAGLALYEPPYNDDEPARERWRGFRRELAQTLAEGRRRDAVGLFMTLLGVPEEQLSEMHQYPMWPMWEGIAPTMAYDAAAIGPDGSIPTARAAKLAVPALVMYGEASYPFMRQTAVALAGAIPGAQLRPLPGQTHEVEPDAMGPALVEWLRAAGR